MQFSPSFSMTKSTLPPETPISMIQPASLQQRFKMENTEGSEGTPTKISDSGYSNSCGNSQSQRSESSKSRHSGSNSSGSSGYGGKTSSLANSNEATPQPSMKHKELKKKKSKNITTTGTSSPETSITTDISSSSSTQNASPNTERTENEKDTSQTTSPSNNNTNVIAQQLKEDLNKECLTPESTHNLQVTHISSPNNEDLEKTVTTPIPSLKAGDVLNTPDSIAEKVTDVEMVCYNSPVNLTNDSYFISKHNTLLIKNQPNHFQSPLLSGFSCVVSMSDGVILYTNSSITTSLGYPKDMWLGRSFIDFVNPKDRKTFSSHITTGIALPLTKSTIISNENEDYANVFCRIRRYRGLHGDYGNNGFGVREREVSYTPFELKFSFRDVNDIETSSMFLMITAIPITSAYLDVKGLTNSFTTRHTSDGLLNHIDSEAIKYIGYLPQDIIGENIFEFYHPDDMPYMKEIYETVVKSESSFKSLPYRFHVQNCDYIKIETEWSTFVNPWSKKLEFIVGHHHVLQGPNNTDVFQSVNKNDLSKYFSDEILNQHRHCQDDILKTMNEVLIKTTDTEKQQISKRCKELAMFMEGFTKVPRRSGDELRIEIPKEKSLSERDSVMLGEISPHHDYCDSKSSTETPPNYIQLNYNENLQRFFESHPWTAHESSTPEIKTNIIVDHNKSSLDTFLKQDNHEKCHPPTYNEFGGSANMKTPPKRHFTPLCNSSEYKPTHLTQDLLNKHNSMMEKQLVKKHKVARTVKAEEREKCERREKKIEFNSRPINNLMLQSSQNQLQSDFQGQEQGLKRSASLTWENDVESHKISKQMHSPQVPLQTAVHYCHQQHNHTLGIQQTTSNDKTMTSNMNNIISPSIIPNQSYISTNNVNHQLLNPIPVSGTMSLWPPFSMTITPFQQTQPTRAESISQTTGNTYSNMHPALYLIPNQQREVPQQIPGPPKPNDYLLQYTMYPSAAFGTQPFVYSQLAMAYQPMTLNSLSLPTITPSNTKPLSLPFDNYRQASQQFMNPLIKTVQQNINMGVSGITNNRPLNSISRTTPNDLQKTSLKAETDMGISSLDSVSLLNPMNVNTEKQNRSSMSKIHNRNEDTPKKDFYGELSSYSSFYSSFVKTEYSNSMGNADSCGETSRKNGKRKCSESSDKSDTIGSKDQANESSSSSKYWEKSSIPTENSSYTNSKKYEISKSQACFVPKKPMRKLQPPWLNSVHITSELIYRYQLSPKNLNDVLESDKNTLDTIEQPSLVNEQLSQLYVELKLEGLSCKLKFDEGVTSSSSEDEPATLLKKKKKYSKLLMIYEEDAPFLSPISD